MHCRSIVLLAAVLAAGAAQADSLRLVPVLTPAQRGVSIAPLKPFEVDLVAERDSAVAEMSAVAYTLDVPDGVLVVGEQLLVESLLGLGTSRTGINLVFRCANRSPLHVLRFRFVATRPLENAVIGLSPEKKTKLLGIVSCKGENFAKFETAPDSILVHSR